MCDKRILIVDDDRGIQQMLRVCLESSGYRIQQATDGAQALDAIERDPPDVVLLDLAMPVLDGMTVLADLQTLLPGGPMQVIVMTAHGSARSAIKAVRLGAADFLEKPFKPDEVRQSIARVLGHAADDATLSGPGAALQLVREALRRGKFIAAEAAMEKAATIADGDPRLLNLAGVLHEAHGRATSARSYYEEALAADESYEPARHNLKRLDQIEQTGSTRLEVALGDEPPAATGEASVTAADRFHRILRQGPPPPSDHNA